MDIFIVLITGCMLLVCVICIWGEATKGLFTLPKIFRGRNI